MTDGKGCKCGAYSYADCGCPDVDWSCGECARLKAELAEAVQLLTDAMDSVDTVVQENKANWGDRLMHKQQQEIDLLKDIDTFLAKHRSTT